METILVNVCWCDKNFAASLGENVPGAVVVTAGSYDDLLVKIPETLRFHIEGMLEDGDEVPQWLMDGEYTFEYRLDTAALLQKNMKYVTLSSIARVTGMNVRLLDHYANGVKRPRQGQRLRIVDGLHKIGKELVSIV
ncbi:MAG: type II toxin-antitoxin system HicB family antitoxin [Porphyromonadaceae bacterium]|nr:type II toxin-antitoxin system HicB family antitoxin [Porphyromonadaceae bacterium]